MARRLKEWPWGRIIVIGLIAVFIGCWYWRDSRSVVFLQPHGKAIFLRGGFFHRDEFELSYYGGRWQFSRGEPIEMGELIVPFECEYNQYRTLRLEEDGKVYMLDKKRMARSELRIVNGEWSYDASDHWQSIFDPEAQLDQLEFNH
jgi:hypothetical protein